MNKFEEFRFKPIPAPDFEGELETLSVKIPTELKETLKRHGEQRDRSLSEVVVHALTQYGLQIRESTSGRRQRN